MSKKVINVPLRVGRDRQTGDWYVTTPRIWLAPELNLSLKTRDDVRAYFRKALLAPTGRVVGDK